MGRNTSDVAGTLFGGAAAAYGEYLVKVVRHDGTIEEKVVKNIVTRMGLNHLANRALLNTTPFYVLGVGTQTAAHSLDSTQGGIGEVIRKAAALSLQSREWVALQCTIGGAADSVTSVALDTAAMFTFPTSYATSANSGGVMGNAANGLGVTLGGSDLLDLTVRIRIGSHDLSHST